MKATAKFLTPPWDMDTAAERLIAEEAAWRDAAGTSFRSYGVQVYQFNAEGLVERRFASQESIAK